MRAFAGNQAGAYRPEDIVAATYRFASGVYGSGAWCYAADFDEEYNEIIGATGRIRFSTSQPVPIRILRGDAVEELPVGDPEHVHQPLIQTIVDELNGQRQVPEHGRVRCAHRARDGRDPRRISRTVLLRDHARQGRLAAIA